MGFQSLVAGSMEMMGSDPFTILIALLIAAVIAFIVFRPKASRNEREPPGIPYYIPFVGSTLDFGRNPVKFLLRNSEKYGDVFTFLMLGRKITYFVGSEANAAFINAKGSDASAEAAYASLTVPVFGKGVLYDMPNHIMVEQKKMCKGALTHEAFETYVPLIEKECRDYFSTYWNKNEGVVDILKAFSELTIMTASVCLLGKEARSKLHTGVAQLYHDLDGGFTPLNFLFPNLPLPSYRKRDEAHIKMRNLFMDIIKKRRENQDYDHTDLPQTLMEAEYKDGSKMTDEQVAHMMIAVLMAGQHTSSATASWAVLFLGFYKDWQTKARQEVFDLFGEEPTFEYGKIREAQVLDQILSETLRLRPPLVQIMRMLVNDIEYKGYKIPKGNYIAVSPTTTHYLPSLWPNAEQFDPERFSTSQEESEENDTNPRHHYIPFGGGRHRCIGEGFAKIQLKTILGVMLSLYDVETLGGKVPPPSFDSLIVLPSNPRNVKYKKLVK